MIRMKISPSTIWLAPYSGGIATGPRAKPRSRLRKLSLSAITTTTPKRAPDRLRMPPMTSMLISAKV